MVMNFDIFTTTPGDGPGEPVNVLLMPTPGDSIVPINGGVALGRAAGFINRHEEDERYGMSQDEWLIDTQVVRGIAERGPWRCFPGTDKSAPCLFDADDLDNGINAYGEPSEEPLRINVANQAGISGFRLPYSDPNGSHGFGTPDPDSPFDISTFGFFQAATYFHFRAQELHDDACMEDATCAWIPELPGGDR